MSVTLLKSPTTIYTWHSGNFYLNEATRLSIFSLFLPISTTFISSLRSSLTRAHPIPSVNPVIATQQSPYFYLSIFADTLAWLAWCLKYMLNRTTNLLISAAPFTVKESAPNKKRIFCQLGVMDLRKMDEKWSESCPTRGILLVNTSTSLMMGFRRRIVS